MPSVNPETRGELKQVLEKLDKQHVELTRLMSVRAKIQNELMMWRAREKSLKAQAPDIVSEAFGDVDFDKLTLARLSPYIEQLEKEEKELSQAIHSLPKIEELERNISEIIKRQSDELKAKADKEIDELLTLPSTGDDLVKAREGLKELESGLKANPSDPLLQDLVAAQRLKVEAVAVESRGSVLSELEKLYEVRLYLKGNHLDQYGKWLREQGAKGVSAEIDEILGKKQTLTIPRTDEERLETLKNFDAEIQATEKKLGVNIKLNSPVSLIKYVRELINNLFDKRAARKQAETKVSATTKKPSLTKEEYARVKASAIQHSHIERGVRKAHEAAAKAERAERRQLESEAGKATRKLRQGAYDRAKDSAIQHSHIERGVRKAHEAAVKAERVERRQLKAKAGKAEQKLRQDAYHKAKASAIQHSHLERGMRKEREDAVKAERAERRQFESEAGKATRKLRQDAYHKAKASAIQHSHLEHGMRKEHEATAKAERAERRQLESEAGRAERKLQREEWKEKGVQPKYTKAHYQDLKEEAIASHYKRKEEGEQTHVKVLISGSEQTLKASYKALFLNSGGKFFNRKQTYEKGYTEPSHDNDGNLSLTFPNVKAAHDFFEKQAKVEHNFTVHQGEKMLYKSEHKELTVYAEPEVSKASVAPSNTPRK